MITITDTRYYDKLGGSAYAKLLDARYEQKYYEGLNWIMSLWDDSNSDDWRAKFGNFFEEAIRNNINEQYSYKFKQALATRDEDKYKDCVGTLDGFDFDKNLVLEIKTGNHIDYNQIEFYSFMTKTNVLLVKFDRDYFCELVLDNLDIDLTYGEEADWNKTLELLSDNFKELVIFEEVEYTKDLEDRVSKNLAGFARDVQAFKDLKSAYDARVQIDMEEDELEDYLDELEGNCNLGLEDDGIVKIVFEDEIDEEDCYKNGLSFYEIDGKICGVVFEDFKCFKFEVPEYFTK